MGVMYDGGDDEGSISVKVLVLLMLPIMMSLNIPISYASLTI